MRSKIPECLQFGNSFFFEEELMIFVFFITENGEKSLVSGASVKSLKEFPARSHKWTNHKDSIFKKFNKIAV